MDGFIKNKKLGRGGYGTVFLVTRRNDGQQFALKQIDLDGMNDDERQGANDEAKTLAKLKHPNIVK